MKVFLIGFMGAGKSFLGKMWSEIYSIPFYDLDVLIEAEERTSVENIFATFGEDYFREREAAVLRNTDRFDNCIIACGGGTPCFFDNIQWMNKNGTTVYLNETEANIYKHILMDKKVRPLINNLDEKNIQTFIKNKLSERMVFYKVCELTLESPELNGEGYGIIEKYIEENIEKENRYE